MVTIITESLQELKKDVYDIIDEPKEAVEESISEEGEHIDVNEPWCDIITRDELKDITPDRFYIEDEGVSKEELPNPFNNILEFYGKDGVEAIADFMEIAEKKGGSIVDACSEVFNKFTGWSANKIPETYVIGDDGMYHLLKPIPNSESERNDIRNYVWDDGYVFS